MSTWKIRKFDFVKILLLQNAWKRPETVEQITKKLLLRNNKKVPFLQAEDIYRHAI